MPSRRISIYRFVGRIEASGMDGVSDDLRFIEAVEAR